MSSTRNVTSTTATTSVARSNIASSQTSAVVVSQRTTSPDIPASSAPSFPTDGSWTFLPLGPQFKVGPTGVWYLRAENSINGVPNLLPSLEELSNNVPSLSTGNITMNDAGQRAASPSSRPSNSGPSWVKPVAITGGILGFIFLLAIGSLIYTKCLKKEEQISKPPAVAEHQNPQQNEYNALPPPVITKDEKRNSYHAQFVPQSRLSVASDQVNDAASFHSGHSAALANAAQQISPQQTNYIPYTQNQYPAYYPNYSGYGHQGPHPSYPQNMGYSAALPNVPQGYVSQNVYQQPQPLMNSYPQQYYQASPPNNPKNQDMSYQGQGGYIQSSGTVNGMNGNPRANDPILNSRNDPAQYFPKKQESYSSFPGAGNN